MGPRDELLLEMLHRYGDGPELRDRLARLYAPAVGWTSSAIEGARVSEISRVSRMVAARRSHASRQSSDWWNEPG